MSKNTWLIILASSKNRVCCYSLSQCGGNEQNIIWSCHQTGSQRAIQPPQSFITAYSPENHLNLFGVDRHPP